MYRQLRGRVLSAACATSCLFMLRHVAPVGNTASYAKDLLSVLFICNYPRDSSVATRMG